MRMKKKKPLTIITILSRLVFGLFVPVFLVGYMIYLVSKLLRVLGLYLMLKQHSARDELSGFFRIWTSIADEIR